MWKRFAKTPVIMELYHNAGKNSSELQILGLRNNYKNEEFIVRLKGLKIERSLQLHWLLWKAKYSRHKSGNLVDHECYEC